MREVEYSAKIYSVNKGRRPRDSGVGVPARPAGRAARHAHSHSLYCLGRITNVNTGDISTQMFQRYVLCLSAPQRADEYLNA
ncbi:hypothetical protein EVAR_101118_1 [Eumeta japonica]|uniref:Uncharacterized protein n=1 Tax=Eumeta variegata TaxID=151549 RepID=A0A4C1T7L6_EUMVA|nr:hypothetical protein EVAR_101118_1 [Eumeta japonica]